MWHEVDGFIDKIKGLWQSYTIGGSPDFILMQTLRRLKKDIQIGTGKPLANWKHKLLEDLALLKQVTENRITAWVEKEKSLQLKLNIQQMAKVEDISWRQKSRCMWLKEGDRNTKFFQKMKNSYRRNNSIDKLLIGEEISEDKDGIEAKILRFYQDLYTENEQWRPSTHFQNLASITVTQKVWLERIFEEEDCIGSN
uniref:Uncharacterized protein n=2 Tax=Nicotiana tabacum TaxID=4097 RepID=A0A1S4CUJ8_TOBAC|nr:PREDICTED: uncharacterized protein LOC107822744 [Nicotiana tabacum]